MTYMDYSLGSGWLDAIVRSHVAQHATWTVISLLVCVVTVLLASRVWRSDNAHDGYDEFEPWAIICLLLLAFAFVIGVLILTGSVASLITWLIEPRGAALREAVDIIGAR